MCHNGDCLAGTSVNQLHSFAGYPSDGAGLDSPVTLASDGNFYGTTTAGGTNCYPYGCGTVFKITPNGTLTTLYNFCSQNNCVDGTYPTAPPVQAADGNFYGTTYGGGATLNGTIYKITANGTLTTLYSFCRERGCPDGSIPDAALVPTGDGNFYGITDNGGTSNYGTVFRLAVPRECTVCPNVE